MQTNSKNLPGYSTVSFDELVKSLKIDFYSL
jgi:hypothetical protein